MKKLLIINEVCGHTSTVKICDEIAEKYEKDGWEVKITYGRDEYVPERFQKYGIRIASDFYVKMAALESRLLDNAGFCNRRNAEKFLKWAAKFNLDMVGLHNLHGYYIYVELLFNWLKEHPEIEKRWTLHDCWAFTGHCVHFTMAKCEKWKTQCEKHHQRNTYPKSLLLERSSRNFDNKRSVFTGVENITIITPSKWIAGLVTQSFLRE